MYATQVSAHNGHWSPQLQGALQWWQALLQSPIYHSRDHGARPKHVAVWADGSWDIDAGTGAIGAVVLTSEGQNVSLSTTIPEHLRGELLATGKQQRNTQSELLAVLMVLLSCPEQLRGACVMLYEDNTPALENMLSGGAADAQSQSIVAAIWLILAVLQVTLWVEWVPSDSNPAD